MLSVFRHTCRGLVSSHASLIAPMRAARLAQVGTEEALPGIRTIYSGREAHLKYGMPWGIGTGLRGMATAPDPVDQEDLVVAETRNFAIIGE
eukprot:4405486-Pyramimonas_sp.AAC.2